MSECSFLRTERAHTYVSQTESKKTRKQAAESISVRARFTVGGSLQFACRCRQKSLKCKFSTTNPPAPFPPAPPHSSWNLHRTPAASSSDMLMRFFESDQFLSRTTRCKALSVADSSFWKRRSSWLLINCGRRDDGIPLR